MPFLKSIVDFDILIEIGYAEEQQHPLTLKQILLMNLSSRTTVRRRLVTLIELGIIKSRKNANDQRSSILTISTPSLKLIGKYGGMHTSIWSSID